MTGTYQDHLVTAEYLRLHPNVDVLAGRRCQKVARTIAAEPFFGGSAIIAWHNIPEKYKRHGVYVEGALSYWDYANRPDSDEFGHATWNARAGITYSTDILGMGRLWRVDYRLIAEKWRMRYLGSAVGTPYGSIALPVSAPAGPPPYPGHPIAWGSPYKAANLAVQRCLNSAGYPTPLTGTYLQGVDTAMRANIDGYVSRHLDAHNKDRAIGLGNPGVVGPNMYASLMTYWAR